MPQEAATSTIKWFEWPKKIYDAIGPACSAVSGAATTIVGVIPIWITPSISLRWTMACAAIGAGLLGYCITPWLWKSWAIKTRRWLAAAYGLGPILGFCMIFVLTTIVNPEMAKRFAVIEELRELLVLNPSAQYFAAGLGSFLATFGLVSGICVLSPHMKKGA